MIIRGRFEELYVSLTWTYIRLSYPHIYHSEMHGKKSQKYQLQCPPVNLEGCFSLGVDSVGSFSKDVNLEPSS